MSATTAVMDARLFGIKISKNNNNNNKKTKIFDN